MVSHVINSFLIIFFLSTLQQISRDYGGQESDYMTDNASVMTDYTCDTFNGSRGGSDNGDADCPEWQEFWDEQAQGKYWYNNISGTAKDVLFYFYLFCFVLFKLILLIISFCLSGSTLFIFYLVSFNTPHWTIKCSFLHFNSIGEASWTKPFTGDEYVMLENVTNTTPVGGMDADNLDWISALDDMTGQEYWYNIKTGESSWA